MGANFSLSGIKKDLEAMKECGIGGATIFNLTSMVRWTCFPTDNVPWPNQTYRSDAYWEALRYACSEAQDIGIELGEMNDIATLEINGVQADTLWYEPYRSEIKEYLHKEKNTITIAVSVNWPNKLIGDEQYPADFELAVADENPLRGRNLQKYPSWFLNHQPRPEQHRKTFTTWHYYTKDSPLQKAGLVGPVKVEFYKNVQ